jgi:hypothetical protein
VSTAIVTWSTTFGTGEQTAWIERLATLSPPPPRVEAWGWGCTSSSSASVQIDV